MSLVRHRLPSVSLIPLVLLLHSQTPPPVSTTRAFFFHVYGNKCLDFSAATRAGGGPIIITPCNSSATQQIVVQEVNSRHEVVLRAGQKVIGIHNPSVITTGGAIFSPASEYSLELQSAANPIDPAFRNQVFALDGDSILWAAQRGLVAQTKDSQGANGTPVIVAARNLADAELWDFVAVNGRDEDPTSGFIRISSRDALLNAITQVNQVASNNNGAAWGNVITIDKSADIELSSGLPIALCVPGAPFQCRFDDVRKIYNVHNLIIPTGVTVRGGRRYPLLGALLHGDYTCPQANGDFPCEYDNVFQVKGTNVRLTGLRMQGSSQCVTHPDSCHSTNLAAVIGIQVGSRVDGAAADVIVDHNELFDWPEAGVNIASNLDAADACPNQPGPQPNFIVVTRNFIHHNENNDGYGVGIYSGGAARIEGNTFLMNRHSISGGNGEVHNQYNAAFNLVLSNVPVYGGNREQDFDMHGTEQPGHWFGGFAGGPVDVHSNTFLGGNRPNFEVRGQPCSPGSATTTPLDRFDFNVTMNSSPVLIIGKDGSTKNNVSINGPAPSSTPYVSFRGNIYDSKNPTDNFGVGDFDGDGKEDLFLATGAAWYYAPEGRDEWRSLNAETDRIDHLRFGDFDGDGRTDVLTMHGRDLLVSWGGSSNWVKINQIDGDISNIAVGDFDGDHYADIFFASGTEWLVASGGSGPFKLFDTSSFRVSDLRFGDFNGDGKTDVFGVANGEWSVTYGGTVNWKRLRSKLTDNVNGLYVADFDGDWRADIVRLVINFPAILDWQISRGGTGDWQSLRVDPASKRLAAIGRFDGSRAGASDILVWNGDFLEFSKGGAGAPFRYSFQEMR